MATKQFTIEINGISLAEDAIQSLLKKLDSLDDKINSLSDIDTSGLKASMSDIRKEISKNVDDWKEISDKINDVTKQVGILLRELRNIKLPFNSEPILQYNLKLKDTSSTLKKIELNKGLNDFDKDVNKSKKAVDDFTNSLNKAIRAEDQLGTKLTIELDGVSLEFDDVNQAIGVLEDKLYLLSASGQKDTQTFKDITKEVVRLKSQVYQVDEAVESAFSGGLTKLVKGVSSITALASVGQGISLLFGTDNAELEKSILKFTALSLILQGAVELQKELTTQTSFVGKSFANLNNILNKGFEKLKLDKVFAPIIDLNKKFKAQELINKIEQLKASAILDESTHETWDRLVFNLNKVKEGLGDSIKNMTGLRSSFELFADVSGIFREFESIDLNETEFERAKQVTLEFRNGLSDDAKEAGNLLKELSKLGKFFLETPPKLTKFLKGLYGITKGLKAVGKAIKGLLKATIVLAALLAAMELVNLALEGLSYLWKQIAGDSSLINQFDALNNEINVTNDALNRYIDNLLKLQDNKVISALTRITESIKEYDKALKDAIKRLKDLSEILDPKSLDEFFKTWADGTTWFSDGIWNMEQFEEQYKKLLKAVLTGTDEGENWVGKLWFTSDDAKSDLAILLKALVEDLQNKINNIDLSKGKEEIEGIINIINSPMYASAIANIENLYPEDAGKALAANIKAIKDYWKLIEDLLNDAQIELRNINDKINDNNVAAIKDRFKRERQELENNYQKELRDAADNEDLKNSIIRKYNAQRELLLRNQAKEVRDIQNNINNNKISALEDGLNKEIALLEQLRKLELQLAKDSEILVGELTKAINDKYDRLILNAKIEFLRNRNNTVRNYNNEYISLYKELAELEYEYATKKISTRYKDKAEELGYTDESIDSIREYYYKLRDVQNEEAKKQAKISTEKSDIDTSLQLKSEEERNLKAIESIKEDYKKGILNKEQYDKIMLDETDIHYKLLQAITRKGELDLINILKESSETSKNNNIAAINEVTNSISNAFNKIKVETKTNKLGIIDYSATKQDLDKAKKEYKTIFDLIKTERDNLLKAFDNKLISFGEFTKAKDELDDLEDQVEDAEKSVNSQLNSLFSEVAESITQYAGQYVNVLGGLWSTFNEILMMKLDLEKARLDEELLMIEDAYSKQEEITLKHTDKLSSIEDELKTARGDRRAHLIEQLNAERAAQIASLLEQEKIEKQKEINEKKQDALEKKRREQEKKNSIVQAMINTYTAVTNALAVQPWFVGVALSSVALAMGLAQVAMISKLKYAKGGLLKGASHSQGGIPVGNTGIEVEGNEYVVNKRSTEKNLPLIDYINGSNKHLTKQDLINFYDSGKKNVLNSTSSKFANGGLLPSIKVPDFDNQLVITDDRPVVVLVVDIVNLADNYRQVQVLAGLNSNK